MPISTGLKKNLDLSHKKKLLLIDKLNSELSISHQAELIGISRSSIYYEPVVDEYDLLLKRLIDEQYTLTPFYGSRRMKVILRQNGHEVNRKHVQRLMREMGIEAIYPKPNLSLAHPEHKIYPYLLRDVSIDRKDQVWAADITYIPLSRGFMYLGGHHGLVEPLRPFLEDVHVPGYVILPGGVRKGASVWEAGNIQYRPGLSVYQQRFYRIA